MNAAAILALVAQAISLLPTLISTGVDVVQRIQQIQKLAESGAAGTTTDAQVKAVRDQLDADLADFNTPIPD
jgi:hypothetical protein